MELVCDNKTVEREVAALHDICEAQGAILHDDLRMVVDQGDIWLESKLPADNRDVLISLPESCLPPLDPVTFKLNGDDLEIDEIAEGDLSDTQARCLKHMVAIYNGTGKARQHRRTSPWFALADAPDLLAHLVSARAGAPKIEDLHRRLQEEGPTDAFVIDSFLGTRKYGAVGSAVLMPFIDYANHHSKAPGFQKRPDSAPGDHRVSLLNAKPLSESDEVRVRYSALDALDAFLIYGFVDTSAEMLRSVPSDLETRNGTIAVESRIGIISNKQPRKEMADLRAYLPQILEHSDNTIRISHMLFPGSGSPLALRRILNWLVRMQESDIGLMGLRHTVKEMEERLLAANRYFYDNLEARSDADGGGLPETLASLLQDLIAHQRQCLEAYASRQQPAQETG